jgi:hypothetical protein
MTAPPRRRAADQDAAGTRLDDAALIERSWHEPEAFAALYDRHAAPIHRFAGRRLGGQLADDVVAETFLAAFGRRNRYDLRRADARPWLYGSPPTSSASTAEPRSGCSGPGPGPGPTP